MNTLMIHHLLQCAQEAIDTDDAELFVRCADRLVMGEPLAAVRQDIANQLAQGYEVHYVLEELCRTFLSVS